MAPRHNLYNHRVQARPAGVFQDVSTNYLQIARGEGPGTSDTESIDSNNQNETRRRSWTREQKLGAVNYASTTYVPSRNGGTELISRNAVANNIGCTP